MRDKKEETEGKKREKHRYMDKDRERESWRLIDNEQ